MTRESTPVRHNLRAAERRLGYACRKGTRVHARDIGTLWRAATAPIQHDDDVGKTIQYDACQGMVGPVIYASPVQPAPGHVQYEQPQDIPLFYDNAEHGMDEHSC